MKLPSKVNIKYKVSYELLSIESFADPDVVGECRFNPNQIVIKKGLSDKQEKLTIIHELVHGVSNEYSIGLTESQVKALEHGLYYVLKNNPKLLKYLLGKPK